MLTKRENFNETIKGGHPDRFVKQFEFLNSTYRANPYNQSYPMAVKGGPMIKDAWGVTRHFPENVPGQFPVHDDEHKVLKDIRRWRDIVKAPSLDFSKEAWEKAGEEAREADRTDCYISTTVAPGLFEQLHYLMGVDDTLLAMAEEPEEIEELVNYILEFELKLGKLLLDNFRYDAIMHHDDFGSYRQSFFSPAMYDRFFKEPYRKLYGMYKEMGVEVVIHHSDCYAANLVPGMIASGIDVFQGCTTPNDVPKLVKEFGGQMSFMGDLDNGTLDKPDWSREEIMDNVRRACTTNGKLYFIPCLAAGGPASIYPGVFDTINECIDIMSEEMF